MKLGDNRLGHLSFQTRRALVGIALLPCLLSVANVYLGWNLFGRFDKQVLVACFILLLLVMRYLGPTVDQVKKYREAARARKS